jgi:two-component sensor histidine kinase
VTIPGELAIGLGLLLHELSTNAVKYGALSSPSGRVAIERADGDRGETVLQWAEHGGPQVKLAQRRGFGTRLLEISLRNQGGKVEPKFDPSGFQASIHLPATLTNPIP